MFSTLSAVLPIFGLILAGYLARKLDVLTARTAAELNGFVVYLALPALLFDIMAKVTWRELSQSGFVAAFIVSSAVVFFLTLFLRRWNGSPLADASLDGLNAAYPNAGFMGIPLCAVALGKESLPPATVGSVLTICGVFSLTIVLIETGLQTEHGIAGALWNVAKSLVRNPLLIAPALGILFVIAGWHVSSGIESFLSLLGGASSPCALVAVGLFLAEHRPQLDKVSAQVVSFKLLLHPAVTWILAYYVFAMPPVWAQAAVLLAALPTGTGSFMLAEFYERQVSSTASAILLSTLGGLLTVTLYLLWMYPK